MNRIKSHLETGPPKLRGAHRGAFGVLIWAMLCTLAAPAFAQDRARTTAVLNIEGEGIDDETTGTLTTIMRNEAQQTMYQVVNASAVNLSDVVILLGCDASSSSCLSRAAAQLEAQILIYGVVTRESTGYRLRVEIYDDAEQKVTHRLQKTVPNQDDIVFTYRRELEQFFRDLRAEKLAASLTITSNVRGASVILNGEQVGTTPFERTGLSPGVYKIEVTKEGFSSWNTEVDLPERAQMRMRAPLQKKRSPVIVEKGPDNNNGDAGAGTNKGNGNVKSSVELPDQDSADANWGGWSLMTVGGLALAGSGVMALLFRGIQRDIAERCGDECTQEDIPPEEYSQLIERGESYELSHRILLGVGVAGVVGGTAWLLVGKEKRSSALRPPAKGLDSLQIHAGPSGVRGTIRF